MGDKTAGAPQETVTDVMVEMLSDSEGTTAQVPAWMAACKHYHGRLSRAREPMLPKLGITNVPGGGIVVVIPTESITTLQFRQIRDLIKHEAKGSVKFIMLPPKMKIQTLSDDDLARFGLQRIPAA